MSSHKVLVQKILSVIPHPNADRLDLVTIEGWVCVTQRGAFKDGDTCIYIPIDSELPGPVESVLFPPDSKIKLSKGRVKTIKIRGCVSQGMVVRPEVLGFANARVGDDLTKALGIGKYEPPVKVSTQSGPQRKVKALNHPDFRKYTDLENIKNYTSVFTEGEQVVVTEKIHGTNFRAGWLPFVARTWWQRVKKLLGWTPAWEFVYGSRNMQLQDRPGQKTYYDTNVYAETVKQYDLRNVIPKGFVIYGEIYGPSVQKGYHYGQTHGHTALAIFDVMRDGVYQQYDLARFNLNAWKLGHLAVPCLYTGPYSIDTVKKLTEGDSVLAPTQKVREGVVVRPSVEEIGVCGRKILKSINADYLLSKHADEEVAHDQVVA